MSHELETDDLPEGVASVYIEDQKVFDCTRFPLILSPTETFVGKDSAFWNGWVKKNLKDIENLLIKHGAILFRGFPLETPTEFDEFAKAYEYEPFDNVHGLGTRASVVGNVYTANDVPHGSKIPFHHEMSFIRKPPLVLFFYCDLPAKEGGETPIVLSNIIYRKMLEREPEFVDRLEREGLRYMRVAPDGDDATKPYGRGWRSTFFVTDREEAEKKAADEGYDFQWLEDGSMKTITEVLPAIRLDRRTGKKMWFNSLFTFAVSIQHLRNTDALGVNFPNGDTISDAELENLKAVVEEAKVSFKWQRRDVVMIDNRTVLHSRSDFFVPPRRIMVSLYSDHQGPI